MPIEILLVIVQDVLKTISPAVNDNALGTEEICVRVLNHTSGCGRRPMHV